MTQIERNNRTEKELIDEIENCLLSLVSTATYNPPDKKAYKLHRVRVLFEDLVKEYGFKKITYNGVGTLFRIDLNNISEYTFEDYLEDDYAYWRRHNRKKELGKSTKPIQ
jgi:hypothetical protein